MEVSRIKGAKACMVFDFDLFSTSSGSFNFPLLVSFGGHIEMVVV